MGEFMGEIEGHCRMSVLYVRDVPSFVRFFDSYIAPRSVMLDLLQVHYGGLTETEERLHSRGGLHSARDMYSFEAAATRC